MKKMYLMTIIVCTLFNGCAKYDPIIDTKGKSKFETSNASDISNDIILPPVPTTTSILAPDPLPPCPEPGSMVPPLIRGDVYRIKDDFNTGADLVVVTTSYRSFSEQLPDPGPNSQLMSNGSYEIWARTGDMVLMALAGEVTDDGMLDVHAMGFRPFVYTEASSGLACDTESQCEANEECIEGLAEEGGLCVRVYEDMDIYVDTPLKQPLKIVLDDPPLP